MERNPVLNEVLNGFNPWSLHEAVAQIRIPRTQSGCGSRVFVLKTLLFLSLWTPEVRLSTPHPSVDMQNPVTRNPEKLFEGGRVIERKKQGAGRNQLNNWTRFLRGFVQLSDPFIKKKADCQAEILSVAGRTFLQAIYFPRVSAACVFEIFFVTRKLQMTKCFFEIPPGALGGYVYLAEKTLCGCVDSLLPKELTKVRIG